MAILSILSAFGGQFLQAILITLYIFSIVCVISLAVSFALAFLSHYYVGFLKWPMRIYVWFFRGIPELVVLLICYLALPQFGILINPIPAAIVAFVLVRIAYDFELIRGTISSVPAGQIEAARALGIPRPHMIARVVLPQILRLAVGPWITQSVGAVKSISLASAISVAEIMHVTQTVITATNRPTEAIAIAAGIYALISATLLGLEAFLGHRYDYLAAVKA